MKQYLMTKGIVVDNICIEDLKKIFYQELINDKEISSRVPGNS